MKTAALLCMATACAAQIVAIGSNSGSIGGVVRDSATGTPVAQSIVNVQLRDGRVIASTADAQGQYNLEDLAAGTYHVEASGPLEKGQTLTAQQDKTVTLAPGQNLTIDFRLPSTAIIGGRVLDEDQKPARDVPVVLVEKRYDHGSLRYRLAGSRTQTDDTGAYQLTGVPVDEVFLVETQTLPVVSGDSPASTFYPNALSPESAAEIVLSPGETRNGVDIRRAKLPVYCVDGMVENGPASVRSVEFRETLVTNSSHAVQHNPTAVGGTKPDGTFHFCGLHRGQYVVTAEGGSPADMPFRAVGMVEIPNGDVRDFKLSAVMSPVSAEFVWDGDPPAPPTRVAGAISLRGIRGVGSQTLSFEFTVPGSLPRNTRLQPDDYAIEVRAISAGWYVKDAICGGRSVLHGAASLGGPASCGALRFVIAHDAASLAVRVADRDGNPISDAYVAIIPKSAATEAEMSASMIFGQAGIDGLYSALVLAPGKYRVLATNDAIDLAANRVDKLWAAQSRAQEVEVGANGNIQLKMEPRSLQ